jgi:YceI-like domain
MQLQVFTFRDGLLARLAHDLQLSVGRFELILEQGRLKGWFDPTSLTVDGVAHGDRVDAAALSAEDKQKIQQTITRELLETSRHPRIELEGKLGHADGQFILDARLRLRGVDRTLHIPLRLTALGMTAEIELAPSQFGIQPYKALGGAIRLQDRVLIRVHILAERDKLVSLASSEQPYTFQPGEARI